MNGQYIRDLPPDEWASVAAPFLPESIKERFDAAGQREILDILHDKVETLADLATMSRIFLDEVVYDGEAKEVLGRESSREVLNALVRELDETAGDWTPDVFKAAVKKAGEEAGKKGKELFFPVRAAITGNLHGPDLARVAAVKGRPSVLKLIARALGE